MITQLYNYKYNIFSVEKKEKIFAIITTPVCARRSASVHARSASPRCAWIGGARKARAWWSYCSRPRATISIFLSASKYYCSPSMVVFDHPPLFPFYELKLRSFLSAVYAPFFRVPVLFPVLYHHILLSVPIYPHWSSARSTVRYKFQPRQNFSVPFFSFRYKRQLPNCYRHAYFGLASDAAPCRRAHGRRSRSLPKQYFW